LKVQQNFFYILLLAAVIFILIQPESFSQSPYKLEFKNEAVIFGIGTALTAATLPLNDNIKPLTNAEISLLNRNDINGFDRQATFNWSQSAGGASDYLLVASILSPALLSLSDRVQNDFTPVITMYFEVLIFSEMLPFFAKGITQRVRPLAYNENVPLEKKKTQNAKRSFFSGHTSTAFAMAVYLSSVYADYYPDSDLKPLVWTSSLLVASTVGYLRYVSGSHFPTDIITGAIIGSAIGYLIPLIHKKENENVNLSIGFSSYGTTLNLQYTF